MLLSKSVICNGCQYALKLNSVLFHQYFSKTLFIRVTLFSPNDHPWFIHETLFSQFVISSSITLIHVKDIIGEEFIFAFLCSRESKSMRINIVAAFRGMHVSPAKHSYAWLPRKCDYRTDRHRTKWSLCATMHCRRHKKCFTVIILMLSFHYIMIHKCILLTGVAAMSQYVS